MEKDIQALVALVYSLTCPAIRTQVARIVRSHMLEMMVPSERVEPVEPAYPAFHLATDVDLKNTAKRLWAWMRDINNYNKPRWKMCNDGHKISLIQQLRDMHHERAGLLNSKITVENVFYKFWENK